VMHQFFASVMVDKPQLSSMPSGVYRILLVFSLL
jgi:hypothetical protein